MQPPERLLTGPGPSNPPPEVTQALAAPLVGHLDPFFLQVMDETMANLRTVFGTSNHHTIPMSATGSGGLETIMLNLLEPGDDCRFYFLCRACRQHSHDATGHRVAYLPAAVIV